MSMAEVSGHRVLSDLDALGWSCSDTPLLSPESVCELREIFFRLHRDTETGWHNTWNSVDRAYRRGTWAVIESALGQPLRDALPGFEPFNFVFLCKWPGSASHLYIHQDWMYVVERPAVRAHTAMVALEDITEANGRPYMVSGSHRLPTMKRGTDLYHPWDQHRALIERRAEPASIAAGSAVFWDTALVHYSVANHTDVPRVAIAVGLKPIGEQLVHYRRSESGGAERFLVDRSFYVDADPASLVASAPDFPLDAIVSADEFSVTDLELDDLLDRSLSSTTT